MNVNDIFGTVNAPASLNNLTSRGGSSGIGFVLSTFVNLLFIIGGTGFVIMIVVAALQWIFSGGDKEKVAGARSRITWAVIGLVLLALARMITAVLQNVLSIKIANGI